MFIEKALKQAEVSTKLEGNHLTAEQKELVQKVIKGEITDEEFNKRVFELMKRG